MKISVINNPVVPPAVRKYTDAELLSSSVVEPGMFEDSEDPGWPGCIAVVLGSTPKTRCVFYYAIHTNEWVRLAPTGYSNWVKCKPGARKVVFES